MESCQVLIKSIFMQLYWPIEILFVLYANQFRISSKECNKYSIIEQVSWNAFWKEGWFVQFCEI